MFHDLASIHALSALRYGSRCGFWFAPTGADGRPRLLLRDLDAAGGDAAFATAAAFAADVAGGLVPSRAGVATVGPTGAVRLCSAEPERGALRDLVRILSTSRPDHPAWRRLIGARWLQIGDEPDEIARDRLWAPLVSGSVVRHTELAALAGELSDARPDTNHWFWLVREGPAGRPTLLLMARAADPEGDDFADRVGAVKGLLGGPGKKPARGIGGLVRVGAEGRFDFVVGQDTPDFQPVLAELVAEGVAAWPELARLSGSRIRLAGADGKPTGSFDDPARWAQLPDAVAPAGPVVQASLGAALTGIPREREFRFWFTASGPDGAPALLLGGRRADPDGVALKQTVATYLRGAAPQSSPVHGKARWERGTLQFTPTGDATGLLAGVARFTKANAGRIARLAALNNASVRDPDGRVTTDPALWAR